MQTFSYGTTPDEEVTAAAQRECTDGDYPIEMHEGSEDFKAISAAVNIGIDAHLEAIRFTEFDGAHGRRGFRFSADTLHVLVRRLGEADDEESQDFRQCILQTLEIEEI